MDIARLVVSILLEGAVGAYWGCCRGCGAHLIWVTTIDAFAGRKLLKMASESIYFTVLHNQFRFGAGSAQLWHFQTETEPKLGEP